MDIFRTICMFQKNSNCNQVGFPLEVGDNILDMEVLGCVQPWLRLCSRSEKSTCRDGGDGGLDVSLVVGRGRVLSLLFGPVLLSSNRRCGLNHYPKTLKREGWKTISCRFRKGKTFWAQKVQTQVWKYESWPWFVRLEKSNPNFCFPVVRNADSSDSGLLQDTIATIASIWDRRSLFFITSSWFRDREVSFMRWKTDLAQTPIHLIACSNGKNRRLIGAIRMNPIATKWERCMLHPMLKHQH